MVMFLPDILYFVNIFAIRFSNFSLQKRYFEKLFYGIRFCLQTIVNALIINLDLALARPQNLELKRIKIKHLTPLYLIYFFIGLNCNLVALQNRNFQQ